MTTGRIYGYMRVSTGHQTTDRQEDALTAAGVDPRDIYRDTITGTKFVRTGLDTLIGTVDPSEGKQRRGGLLRAGDVLVVQALDRLGRSLSQIIQAADELRADGIVLRALKEGIDYSTPTGRMLAGIFGSLAEYERELMLERVADARAAARTRGMLTGRPPTLTDAQRRQIRQLHAGGEKVASLVDTFKVSRRTIYRALEVAE